MISGIYKIVNKVNGKYYVGSSYHIHERWTKHRRALNKGIHYNIYLQRAWNKYGSKNFEFVIIEECYNDLLKLEQSYLDICKSKPKTSYNATYHSSGGLVTDEIVSKIKQAWTPEKRKSHADRYIGDKNPFFGKHHTDENLLYMKLLKKDKPLSKSHRLNISKATTGSKNPSYDPTLYKFVNPVTNEIFIGTKFEFRQKYKVRWKTPKSKWRWTLNDYCLPEAMR